VRAFKKQSAAKCGFVQQSTVKHVSEQQHRPAHVKEAASLCLQGRAFSAGGVPLLSVYGGTHVWWRASLEHILWHAALVAS